MRSEQRASTSAKIQFGSSAAEESLWKALSRAQKDFELNDTKFAKVIGARPSTFSGWKKDERIPLPPQKPERLPLEIEQIVTLLAIYRSLAAIFSKPVDIAAWFKAPHPDLFNTRPVDFVSKSSENLFSLRHYLDYVRGQGA